MKKERINFVSLVIAPSVFITSLLMIVFTKTDQGIDWFDNYYSYGDSMPVGLLVICISLFFIFLGIYKYINKPERINFISLVIASPVFITSLLMIIFVKDGIYFLGNRYSYDEFMSVGLLVICISLLFIFWGVYKYVTTSD